MKHAIILLTIVFALSANALTITEFIATPTGSESIELYNDSTGSVDLADFYLVVNSDTFLMIAETVPSGGYTVVDTSKASGMYLPNAGATLMIEDPINFRTDVVSYGIVGAAPKPFYAWSCARVASTGNNAADFNLDATPTMGFANDAPSNSLGSGTVFINEVYPDAVDNQFIELYNSGGSPVDISGWIISCDDDYYVPASTSISAGGYYTITEADFPAFFSMDVTDNVYLFNSAGVRLDQTGFNSVATGNSHSVIPNGTRTSYTGFDSASAIDFTQKSPTQNANNDGNSAPAINSMIHAPSPVYADSVVTIITNATDDSGIFSDSCYFNVNGGAYSGMISDSSSGNDYYFGIGTFSLNDTVSYYCAFTDDSSVTAYSDTNTFIVLSPSSGSININGYTIYQYNSSQSYTFGDIDVPAGGYLVLGRNADQASFEAYWGVTFGSDVVYVNGSTSVPQINGSETFSLYDNLAIFVDTTNMLLTSGNTAQRDATNADTWTQSTYTDATPGSGVTGGNNAGLVITEASDALGTGNYIYEYVELFLDMTSGPSNTPPQFGSVTQTPATPQPLEKVIVYSRIYDNSSVAGDSLFYRVNSGSWISVSHDSTNIDTFYFTIPSQAGGTDVDYYLWAIDDQDSVSITATSSYTHSSTSGAGKKLLFDFTKEEDAGNADWIIDTNYPVPLPADPTAEDDWLGAISSWGFEADTAGFECYTLPPDSIVKYGSASPMDLENFDVYIVCEPQNPFVSSEKTAIFNFVNDGGGLFMVADHVSSDRNSSGWDSPMIWDDLPSDNFGIHFQQISEGDNNFSPSSSSFTGLDSIYNGPYGNATSAGPLYYHSGTTMPANSDPDVIEIAPVDGDATRSMLTVAYYGNGRVAGMGDSSPADDSTGQAGNTLYDGWNEGSAKILIMNTTWWLSNPQDSYIGTAVNDVHMGIDYSNGNVLIRLDVSEGSNLSFVRIYRKSEDMKPYEYRGTYDAGHNMLVSDNVEDVDGRLFYKITGVDKQGNEQYLGMLKINIAINDVKLEDNLIYNSSMRIKADNGTPYSVLDKTGRLIQSGTIEAGTVDLSNIKPGIYFLRAGKEPEKFILIK